MMVTILYYEIITNFILLYSQLPSSLNMEIILTAAQ